MSIKNNFQKILFFIIIIVLNIKILASPDVILQGTVQTVERAKLPGVLIMVKDTDKKTITDENGFFKISLVKEGRYMVLAIFEGFQVNMQSVTLVKGKTVTADFTLQTEIIQHKITVTHEMPKLIAKSQEIGVLKVKPKHLETLPALGEKDIFRSLQLIPGISASNESSSGLYVRGGKPDENLVLYDGFTIYHVDHFFGIFSAFNANAIDSVTLYKGGFESKFGGRLSSVMEITGKSGNNEKIIVGGGINFLSFNGFVEGPIGKFGEFFISGRKSFQSSLYDKILDKYNDDTRTTPVNRTGGNPGGKFGAMFEAEPSSYFYDLNAKALFRPSKKDIVSLSFYNGMDDVDNSREMEIPSFMAERAAERGFSIDVEGSYTDLTQWGNTGLSLNWQRQWSNQFFSHFTVAYSDYRNEKNLDNSMRITRTNDSDESGEDPIERNIETVSEEKNTLNDLTFRFNNTWEIGQNHQLQFGTQVTTNEVEYLYDYANFRRRADNSSTIDPESVLNTDDRGITYAFYLQDKISLFNVLKITPGVRATYFDRTEEFYFEPRFSLILQVSDRIHFKAAWGKYHQFANNLVREDLMRGNREFWLMADGETIPVGKATHYIAGLSYETNDFLFDIEGYYKDLEGLSEYSFQFTPNQEVSYTSFFHSGTGKAMGLELLLQKKFGNFTGWICYTLGQVEYTFPDYETSVFPASHDVTHEIKIVSSLNLNKWNFSATWIFATGKPYTEPLEAYQEVIGDDNGDREFVINRITYGPKNGARLPDYHRLDFSMNYNFEVGGSKWSAGLSLFNVYNHTNVWRKEYDIAEDELIATDVTYLGFTPSLFLKIFF